MHIRYERATRRQGVNHTARIRAAVGRDDGSAIIGVWVVQVRRSGGAVGVKTAMLVNREQGRRQPDGRARVVLALIAKKPGIGGGRVARAPALRRSRGRPRPTPGVTMGETHRLRILAAEEWSVGPHPVLVAPDRDRQEACRSKTVRRVRIDCAPWAFERCAINAHPANVL